MEELMSVVVGVGTVAQVQSDFVEVADYCRFGCIAVVLVVEFLHHCLMVANWKKIILKFD
jgi:hypothetical protein